MSDGCLTLGLVLTLRDDSEARRQLLHQLEQRDDVLVAPAQGHRLPLALETRVGRDQAALRALEDLPGVVLCDVVYAHFDACEDAP